jgi:AraC-like DNA-binding protein
MAATTSSAASPATSSPATVRFSTRDFPQRERLAIAHDLFGHRVVKADIAPLPDRPFDFEMVTRMLPGLHVSSMSTSGLHVQRMGALLADGDDNLSTVFCTAGTMIVSQRGRNITAGRGAAVSIANEEAGGITYPSLSRWRCVNLPRKALAPLVPEIDDVAMRPIPGDSEALRLLIDYFVALDASPLATPELQHLAANHVLDLVAVMLGATRDAADVAQGRGMRAARLAAIKAGIAKNLHGVGLSIDALAAQNGVSTRHVQLLFEDEGTTFTQFVLAERLARAHRILTDARFADRPISTIAFAAGFGDLSYFNRTFRRRFGATPSDVRAAASARDKT